MTKDTQVLVVGAGPTGLIAANILAAQGLSICVIDKGETHSTKSKAIGIHAGTLERLTETLGGELTQKLIDRGYRAFSADFHIEGRAPIRVDLSSIPSSHNYVLCLEQNETEAIFEAALAGRGIEVMRRHELIDLKPVADVVEATIRSGTGEVSIVRTQFVIGCDGAHSAVRKLSNIEFSGGSYQGLFTLADVHLRWPWPFEGLRVFLGPKGVAACFPLRGEGRYRLILVPNHFDPSITSMDLTLEELRENAREYFPRSMSQKASGGGLSRKCPEIKDAQADLPEACPLGTSRKGRAEDAELGHFIDETAQRPFETCSEEIEILDSVWMTRFRVHHRIAQKYRAGRVFLAGDAAHIHSPVGAQGMNTGIHDAIHLSSKIAAVLMGTKEASWLDTYEGERKAVAKRVLKATDLVFRFLMTGEHWLTRAFRRGVLPTLIARKGFQRRIARKISQVDVARRERESLTQ